jgi:hypothetical protein
MRRGEMEEQRIAPPPATAEAEAETEPTCVHHWIIEPPAGASSMGICKVCGAEREFQNYAGDFIWEGDSTESYAPGGWKKPVTELVRPDGIEGEDSSFASAGPATTEERFI